MQTTPTKPLKRLRSRSRHTTGLKPGANEKFTIVRPVRGDTRVAVGEVSSANGTHGRVSQYVRNRVAVELHHTNLSSLKGFLGALFLFTTLAAFGDVFFIPPDRSASPNKFKLPADLAERVAQDISSIPVEYLDHPPLPAIADYQIESGGQVYWCYLTDYLFLVPSDRRGLAKVKRVPAIGFLSRRLNGGHSKDGGGLRTFLADKNLQATVIRELRAFYQSKAAETK